MKRKLTISGTTVLLCLAFVYGYLVYLQIRRPAVSPTTYTGSGDGPCAPISERPFQPRAEKRATECTGTVDSESMPRSGPQVSTLSGNALLLVSICDEGGHGAGVMTLAVVASEDLGNGKWRQMRLPAYSSNSDGKAEIQCNIGWSLEIIVESKTWFAPKQVTTIHDAHSTLIITVCETGNLHFSAEYGDLQSFAGAFSLRAPEIAEGTLSAASYYYFYGRAVANETTHVTSVPTGKALTLTLFSGRAGFDNLSIRVEPHQVLSGEKLIFTIPKSPKPQGTISIDLRAFLDPGSNDPQEAMARVQRLDAGIWVFGEAVDLTVQGVVTTQQLPPGAYTAKVVCGDRVWSAGNFALQGGEKLVLVAQPSPGAVVKATILDERGQPIEGAAMKVWDGEYPSWPTVGQSGAIAVSGKNGIAELGSIVAGDVDLFVDARGYESCHVSVMLNPGNMTDIGRIVLQPASGAVFIRFVHADPNLKYRVGYVNRGTGPSSMVEVTDEEIKFGVRLDRLPLRPLNISAYPVGGGRGAHVTAELSDILPFVEVELDLAKATPLSR